MQKSKDIQAQIKELQEQLSALEAADSPEILLQTVREKITQLESQLHPTGKAESTDDPLAQTKSWPRWVTVPSSSAETLKG
jgi:hypothetical protein